MDPRCMQVWSTSRCFHRIFTFTEILVWFVWFKTNVNVLCKVEHLVIETLSVMMPVSSGISWINGQHSSVSVWKL